ncbi:discoidin domain-containing protein [Massilia aerilata]|uniref:Discoidin domain-containing protein n=1 Tax=Massilia aerilata TaxID=453817 RepID=A0ABW0S083_9BURK
MQCTRIACAAALLALSAAAAAQERTLDDFERVKDWKTVVSDGVKGTLSQAPGHAGLALRMDFDLGASAGYVAARRALPLDFEGDYEISFWMRADAPVINFELKLVDGSGENVWWVSRPNFTIAKEWRKYTFKRRHIAFAWGPGKDHSLRHTEHLEFVVSSGREGGHGRIEIDDLTIRQLPPAGPLPDAKLSASSGRPAPGLLDGGGAWASTAAGEQYLDLDFGRAREFGGLVLHWAPDAHASRYEIQFSDDGSHWRTLRRVDDGDGGRDPILLTESDTRYLRIAMHGGPGARYALERVDIKPLDFGATANAFFQALAREAPRGRYPRGMSGEQSYWTVLGVEGGVETGLLSEDGALEVARAGFTVEPFVLEQGRLRSWADVRVSQSLQDGYLPIPSVTWQADGWQLRTTAFAHGTPDQAQLVSRYQLRNDSGETKTLRLVLALRPFQVNPPMQFLNTPPGVSKIGAIAWRDGRFEVDGNDGKKTSVFALNKPDAAGVSSFDADAIPSRLAGEGWRARRSVEDSFGFASGALAYDVTLAPHASAEVALLTPLSGEAPAQGITRDWAQAAQEETAALWRKRLNEVILQVPPQGQRLVDTLRSSLAHMLMTRSGPALQPGTRSYARSWIRDGAMMSEGMLRLGKDQVAKDYARWFAPYQFANGKIPCCVDRRGADPVPENDSQGEFIFMAAELWRYTHDRALLQALWPGVAGAAKYMEQQRQSERGPRKRTPERKHMFGLLPPSISHEGYSAKPMHAYWDDFWGLRGYRDAAMLAGALGKKEDAARLRKQGGEFERELLASLRATAQVHHIDYLAGAADLGDFDATSTTIALSPGRLQQRLPQDLLHATFERYWREFVERRDGDKAWKDYTPYELRNVAAFVRLGWRDRAHALLDFFMRDRRPEAWNGWAEVVGRLPREPRFVGDMPHGWISSDYIRSALDLFAYERDTDRALVIADGIPVRWLAGEGIAVHRLRTPYGPLSYAMKQDGASVTLDLEAGSGLPPGGIVLREPGAGWDRGRSTVNGKPAQWKNKELRIRTLPATVRIDAAIEPNNQPTK